MIKHKLSHYPSYKLKSYIEYHDDIPHIEENYDEDGNLHGAYREWDDKGQVALETNFIHGIRNGMNKKWYSNGKLYSQEPYTNDHINGIAIQYYTNGQIAAIDTYKNGTLHGEQKHYYPNGQLATEVNFVNGRKHGVFKQYIENGQMLQWSTYKADTLINSKTFPLQLEQKMNIINNEE